MASLQACRRIAKALRRNGRQSVIRNDKAACDSFFPGRHPMGGDYIVADPGEGCFVLTVDQAGPLAVTKG